MNMLNENVIAQEQSGLHEESLENIRRKAAESHSDAVLVFKDDNLVLEWYSGNKPPGPIELMSCTKSIVNIAIGRLIDQGKIKSLDQPVYEFFPEWKQGKKHLITIRHLLNHTSGLQNNPVTTFEIYPSPDFVKLALAAELSADPGSEFRYNNKAVNLLAGIVQAASGKRMDLYCSDEIFRPMGITETEWTLDKAGNPHGMSGLKLTAKDFAKFGHLLLNKGIFNDTRIVSEKWIEESVAPGQPFEPLCGLLWWRIPDEVTYEIDDAKLKELEAANVDIAFLGRLTPLKNKTFDDWASFSKGLADALGSDYQNVIVQQLDSHSVRLSRKTYGKLTGYNANGYLGQYLVVFPEQKLVAVRQVQSSDKYSDKTDGFDDFVEMIKALSQQVSTGKPGQTATTIARSPR